MGFAGQVQTELNSWTWGPRKPCPQPQRSSPNPPLWCFWAVKHLGVKEFLDQWFGRASCANGLDCASRWPSRWVGGRNMQVSGTLRQLLAHIPELELTEVALPAPAQGPALGLLFFFQVSTQQPSLGWLWPPATAAGGTALLQCCTAPGVGTGKGLRGLGSRNTQPILLNSAKKQRQALNHQKFSNRRDTLSSIAGKISPSERKNKSLGVLELLVKVRRDMGTDGEDSGTTLFISDPRCIQKARKIFFGFFLHATR